MTEADKVSELHQEVKNNLLNEDLEKVKNWQKDAYHKQIMGGFKETKEAEDGFRKAQKPWAKKMKEVPSGWLCRWGMGGQLSSAGPSGQRERVYRRGGPCRAQLRGVHRGRQCRGAYTHTWLGTAPRYLELGLYPFCLIGTCSHCPRQVGGLDERLICSCFTSRSCASPSPIPAARGSKEGLPSGLQRGEVGHDPGDE